MPEKKEAPVFAFPYAVILEAVRSFGVSSVIVGVLLLVGYQTIPKYIESNIETQQRLANNLDIQTQNLVTLGETLQELQEYGRATAEFRDDVLKEHAVMQASLDNVKTSTDTMQEEQKRQREEHRAIVESLKLLCAQLKDCTPTKVKTGT